MIRCLHCNAETSNGLALCEACQVAVLTYLEFVPVYFRNLARWRRPGRPNGSLGSARQWMLRYGDGDTAQLEPAVDRALGDITDLAGELTNTPPTGNTEADTFALLCDFLEANIARIAARPDADRFARDIARHERTLRSLTETIVPGWYAGACQQPSGRDMEGNQHICGASTYVVPGLTWVTCPQCGTTTHARDHVDVVLHEAADWVAPPMRLAEAVVQLVDTEHSVPRLYERIRKWGQRDRITSIRPLDAEGDPYGPHKYRLGDVLDRLHREGPSVDVRRILLERRARITGLPVAYLHRRARITGKAA